MPESMPCALVLVEPQDPINVGSVIRVCRNFGVHDLRLLRPAAVDPRRWSVTAPGSEAYVHESVRVVNTWVEAVEGLTLLCALSGHPRREPVARWTVEQAAEAPHRGEGRVGFVFGREDHGLPNAVLDACHAIVTIDTAPDATSLNLAQAVLLVMSRVYALGDQRPSLSAEGLAARHLAPAEDIERMMAQAERALEAIAFFKGTQRANVLRTLRRVFLRAGLDERELATFWGIFREVEGNTLRLTSGQPPSCQPPTTGAARSDP